LRGIAGLVEREYYRIMKLSVIYTLALILSIIFTSCEQDECCQADVPQDLIGDWLLTERGYSPGDRYIVESVDAVPAQTINLQENQQFSSNISGLEDFTHFQVLDDPDTGTRVLALLPAPPSGDLDINNLDHSYDVVFEDGLLKLYFRYCFEGCHLGFIKGGQ